MKRALLLLLLSVVPIAGNLRANSCIYTPLNPPKAEDIVAFTNGLPPGTGVQTVVSREKVLRFLRRGKANPDIASWYAFEYPRQGAVENCEGVMVDRRGQFIFWRLCSAKTLKLQTPDGHFALLQLP